MAPLIMYLQNSVISVENTDQAMVASQKHEVAAF